MRGRCRRQSTRTPTAGQHPLQQRCRHAAEYPGSAPVRQVDQRFRREHHTADARRPCPFYLHHRVTTQGTNLAPTVTPEGTELTDRATRHFRVEGFDAGGWMPLSSLSTTQAEAELRLNRLRARFPSIPMRIVAEATVHTVIRNSSGQTPPTEGDQVT